MASVSQLCYLPLFIMYYMGCCNDCLTCDIAFNAVMPLSRASTRGSYSRIEGVSAVNGTESPAAAAAEERRGRGGGDAFCFVTARVGSAPHIYVRPRVERRGLNPRPSR